MRSPAPFIPLHVDHPHALAENGVTELTPRLALVARIEVETARYSSHGESLN